MGISTDSKVYGVCWNVYSNDTDEKIIRRFDKTYHEPLTPDQIKEIQEEYLKLTEDELTNLKMYFYTSCSDTYSSCSEAYMSWFSIKKYLLVEYFIKGEV